MAMWVEVAPEFDLKGGGIRHSLEWEKTESLAGHSQSSPARWGRTAGGSERQSVAPGTSHPS